MLKETLNRLRSWNPSENTNDYKEYLWKLMEKKMKEDKEKVKKKEVIQNERSPQEMEEAELDDESLDAVAGGVTGGISRYSKFDPF